MRFLENRSSPHKRRTAAAPETITIKGSANAIADIDSIDTEEIDITYIYERTDIDLQYVLPEGIYLANESRGLKAHVTIAEKKKESSKDKDAGADN